MDLSDPFLVVAYCLLKEETFPFSKSELRLLNKIKERSFSGESTCVGELHELRCLYWQVVGYERRPSRKQGKSVLAPPAAGEICHCTDHPGDVHFCKIHKPEEVTKKQKALTPPIEYDDDDIGPLAHWNWPGG